MKNASHRAQALESTRDLYRRFMRLERGHRRAVALRILRNQRLLADLYDHFLIQEALENGGQSISWKNYRRAQRPAS